LQTGIETEGLFQPPSAQTLLMSDEATYLKQGNGRNRCASPRCSGFIFWTHHTSWWHSL